MVDDHSLNEENQDLFYFTICLFNFNYFCKYPMTYKMKLLIYKKKLTPRSYTQ